MDEVSRDTPEEEVLVAEREKRYELERLRRIEEARAIFSTPGGRYFLWRILASTKAIGGLSIVFGEPDKTYFHEGRRSVGNEIYDMALTACPDIYTIMRNEAIGREKGNE